MPAIGTRPALSASVLYPSGELRAGIIVVFGRLSDDIAGIVEGEEQALVEQSVAHPAVETLDAAILRRFAGAMQCHSTLWLFD